MSEKAPNSFSDDIDAKAQRKIRARNSKHNVWFGLGMMGLIGWSIVIPTLIGAGLGWWIDHSYPSKHAWTLSLLVAGLILGCWNAWQWISKEDKEINNEQENER